jgi:hypothetical protein
MGGCDCKVVVSVAESGGCCKLLGVVVAIDISSKIAGRNSRKYVVVQIDNTNTVTNDEKSNMADIFGVCVGVLVRVFAFYVLAVYGC